MSDKIRYKNSMIEYLGIIFTCDEEPQEKVIATMPVNSTTSQPNGILHGGASVVLAESIAGHGSTLICPEGFQVMGVQVSANHISAVPLGEIVTGTGKLLHKGRSSHIWNIDVTSQKGKLVSSIRVVNFICKRQ